MKKLFLGFLLLGALSSYACDEDEFKKPELREAFPVILEIVKNALESSPLLIQNGVSVKSPGKVIVSKVNEISHLTVVGIELTNNVKVNLNAGGISGDYGFAAIFQLDAFFTDPTYDDFGRVLSERRCVAQISSRRNVADVYNQKTGKIITTITLDQSDLGKLRGIY